MAQRSYYKLNDDELVIGGTSDETSVFTSGGFLLTNRRAIHIDQTDLRNETGDRSMNLEDIDAIESAKIRHPVYILLTVFSILFAALFDELGPSFGCFLSTACAIYFIFTYYSTRGEFVRLVSSQGFMILNVSKLFDKEVAQLVEEIDQARSRRIAELSQSEP